MRHCGKFYFVVCTVWTSIATLLFLLAKPAGPIIAARLETLLLKIGKGKISNPPLFITERFQELAALSILTLALLAICAFFWKWISGARHSWLYCATCIFAAVNLWLAAAMHTCLFWGSLYTGSATSNFTQFQFKKLLLTENKVPRQFVLLGSSQTQAQLDENVLNRRLSKKIWTTELHYPGSQAVDLLLIARRLREQPFDDAVCYLSEYYFYAGVAPTTAPLFLAVTDFPVLQKLGFGESFFSQPFFLAVVGNALPLFRCREPLIHRTLGIAFASVPQDIYDSNLETNLLKRAEQTAPIFRMDDSSRLQKRAFEEFVRELGSQGRKVILLEGQVNPLLAQKIPKSIRADMKVFLREIAQKYSNVTLISEETMPVQAPADYKDLTHVNDIMQDQFSEWFASFVKMQQPATLGSAPQPISALQ